MLLSSSLYLPALHPLLHRVVGILIQGESSAQDRASNSRVHTPRPARSLRNASAVQDVPTISATLLGRGEVAGLFSKSYKALATARFGNALRYSLRSGDSGAATPLARVNIQPSMKADIDLDCAVADAVPTLAKILFL